MTGKKKRGLSPKFMKALKTGVLKRILELVRNDNTLDLQIRDDYINIYYRGGNLLKVVRDGSHYEGEFDLIGYMQIPKKNKKSKKEDDKKDNKSENVKFDLSSDWQVAQWVIRVPHDKFLMDTYFTRHPSEEREAQQLIVRENNYGSLAKSTDYFICDIEYGDSYKDKGKSRKFRCDMIATHWPSTRAGRVNTKNIGLAFIEVKYGDGALAGTAGINKHLKDMKAFLSKKRYRQSVAKQMKEVFNQKIGLGEKEGRKLIKISKGIDSFETNTHPEYIFILGNHNPRSTKLGSFLDDISDIDETTLPFKLKFAVSNFMGFGLYDQCIYTLDEFREKFEKGIHSK